MSKKTLPQTSADTNTFASETRLSGQFAQIPRELIALLPTLTRAEILALFRVIEEHLSKGGTETHLKVTQKDFAGFGVRRPSIASAIGKLSAVMVGGFRLPKVAPDANHKGNLKPVNVFQLPWLPRRGNVVRVDTKTEQCLDTKTCQGVGAESCQDLDTESCQAPRHENVPSFLKLGSRKESREESRKESIAHDGFESFWNAYPRKTDKAKAIKAYHQAVKHADAETIQVGAERYAIERQGQDPTFTKYPATWLNGRCWNNAPEPLRLRQQSSGLAAVARGIMKSLETGDSTDDF
jgi:hypothetical protein